ncbi:MAG: MSHA biogenesis protein MshJ [Alteromonadaceae bacterium]|jgi:MSHA biogenesis protein MshJ
MKQWHVYTDKFLTISPREQYLILLSGLVLIGFVFFTLAIESKIIESRQLEKNIKQLSADNRSQRSNITMFEQALQTDPNVTLRQQILTYEHKLNKVDAELLTLTSELIDPIQMRYALLELLKVKKGVSLLSFELVGAKKVVTSAATNNENNNNASKRETQDSDPSLSLYRHGIKLKLKGRYFQLRDYLTQLESLPWTFFWQKFDYKIKEYPISELEIEMYSLSTKKEFIGV